MERLTQVIGALGGPQIAPEDVEWATALPAGAQLIAWFASNASQDALALEDEEFRLLKRARELRLVDPNFEVPDNLDSEGFEGDVPSGYKRPSQLNSFSDHATSSRILLDAESARLQHRLRLTKSAAKKNAQSISALRRQLDEARAETKKIEEKISEVSLSADAALEKAAFAAHNLLASPPLSDSKNKANLETHTANKRTDFQTSIQTDTLTRLREQHESLLIPLSSPSAALSPSATEVRNEAARLTHLLPNVDVRHTLERAWTADRAAELKEKESVVDETNVAFVSLLSHLKGLHVSLSARAGAQAALGAFVEELAEVLDDLQAVRQNQTLDISDEEQKEPVLEAGLKEILRKLQDIKRPLVLLDRSDVLTEMRRVVSRKDAYMSEQREKNWMEGIHEQLGTLSQSHVGLLTLLETQDNDVCRSELEGEAKAIQEAVATLEEDGPGDREREKRIRRFVERWARG